MLVESETRKLFDRSTLLALCAIAVYLGALVWRYDSVPPTLVTDTVDEVETGFRFVRDGNFTVLSFDPFVVGVETLWVSLNGLLVMWTGHTAFAALAPGWLAVTVLLLTLVLLARLSRGRIDPLIVVLTAISMIWLFHYGRIGYRVMSTTFFLSLSLAGMLMFLRDEGRGWRGPALLGSSMALGMYCYTSSRIVPIAFVIFMLGHLAVLARRSKVDLRRWAIAYSRICAIALIVSIPNIEYAIREPARFFGRGVGYNIKSQPSDWPGFVIESLILPVFYDHSAYTEVVPSKWLFDPGAVTLPSAGISAVPPIIGIAAAFGVVMLLRKERGAILGTTIFGLLCYCVACLLIGFIGPSLTRLLINLPLVALAGAVGLTCLSARFRVRRWICLTLIIVFAVGMVRYVSAMKDPFVRSLFAPGAREMAAETLARSGRGQRVAVMLRQRINVFEYYVYDHRSMIDIFDAQHLDDQAERVDELVDQSDVIIVEDDKSYLPLIMRMRNLDSFVEVEGRREFSHVFERVKKSRADL